MKFLKTLLALFLATGAESKPYQFYGYPETNYQPIYEEFAVQQNDEQDFYMETPYEYAPMIDNTQIISTYTQDHFVQDLGTQEYIVETPDFAYVEDNYVPIQHAKVPAPDEVFRRISFELESYVSNLPLSILREKLRSQSFGHISIFLLNCQDMSVR